MRTLLLDRTTWDLVVDAGGNLAVADDPYAITQDVASAVRTFQGTVYYDTTQGVPHFQQILGHRPPLSVLKNAIEQAALTVPEVISATAYVTGTAGREVIGQIHVKDSSGQTTVLSGPLSSPSPA